MPAWVDFISSCVAADYRARAWAGIEETQSAGFWTWVQGREVEAGASPGGTAAGVSCGAAAGGAGFQGEPAAEGLRSLAEQPGIIGGTFQAVASGDARGFEAIHGGLDCGEDRRRRRAEEDGLIDGGLDVLAPQQPVGGVAVHDGFQVGDDRGGLLSEQRGVGGDGLEIVLAGEAVGAEAADDGFDMADQGRLGFPAEEVRVGGGGPEVVLSHGRVGGELLVHPCGVASRLELFGACGRRLLQALHRVEAGGDAV